MASTLDTILSFLRAKGLTPAQAAGVAGNLQVESGFNPTAANPREGAIGLAQWEGGRRTALQAYAAAHNSTETDLLTQLSFLWSELQGPESGALSRLTATNDPGTAAAVFDQYYERSSGAARAQRVANAQAIAGGHPTADGGPTTATKTKLSAEDPGLLGGLNPFANWSTDGLALGLKLGAVGIAGALVVVGVLHTVSK
jgi:hypothetical protein